MIAEQTWQIYKANATWLILAGLLAEALQAGLALLFGGYAARSLSGVSLTDFSLQSLSLSFQESFGPELIGVGLLYVILSVLLGVFTASGLIESVVQAQNGKLTGLGAFWSGGVRFWARMLGYGLLTLLPALVLGLAGLLAMWIPLLFIPLLTVAFGSLGVSYWYAAYALVAEDLSAGDAFARLFRILGLRFSDVIWSLLLLVAAGLVLGLVSGILSLIPLIGPPLTWLLNGAVTPLLLLYAGVRYAANIAPAMGPPGGRGNFHTGPPPGP